MDFASRVSYIGAIVQIVIWMPVWLLLMAEVIWTSFPFGVAAVISIYLGFAPMLVALAITTWHDFRRGSKKP